MTKDLPSPELLRKLLRYEPDTGKLFWRERTREMFATKNSFGTWNTKFANKEAFTAKDTKGYLQGGINGSLFKAHRVAWVVFYGAWPKKQIDHINCIRDDNRILNLREATNQQNGFNRNAPSSNTSGFKGVHWNKKDKKWQAHIRVSGKRKHLGYFDCPEVAAAAYEVAAQKYHGQFANTKL
jgi:hypothetical protein